MSTLPSYTAYSPPSTLQVTTWGGPVCATYSDDGGPGTSGDGASYRRALEQVAKNTATYGDYPLRQRWIAQMQAYRVGVSDTGAYNCSAVLQDYVTTAAPTRYAWLTALEDTLYKGYDVDATAMLLASPPAASVLYGTAGAVVADSNNGDSIVANYLSYFNLYLKWRGGKLYSSDTAALTALCPMRDGAVIYQARALLTGITGINTVYDDNCSGGGLVGDGGKVDDDGGGGSGGSARMANPNTVIAYSVLPNPNNGYFMVSRNVSTMEPVLVEVSDVIGRKIWNKVYDLSTGEVGIQLPPVSAGMYMVAIYDAETKKGYNFKIAVQ